MELLLALLSLLTAATGAVAGARAPEPGVHQSAAGIVAVAPAHRTAPRTALPSAEPALPGRATPRAASEAPPREDAPLATERLIE